VSVYFCLHSRNSGNFPGTSCCYNEFRQVISGRRDLLATFPTEKLGGAVCINLVFSR
jgi:hypothetical protein